MPDSLILTLVTGETVSLEVKDGRAELERFLSSDHEYTREWIKIDDQKARSARRDRIGEDRRGPRLNDFRAFDLSDRWSASLATTAAGLSSD